jgi:hypothetical protein
MSPGGGVGSVAKGRSELPRAVCHGACSNGGFLTPEQWTEGLQVTGFVDVRVLPNIARIREEFPAFYSAAIAARRAV